MKPKLIFDFDGTIADTLDLLFEIADKIGVEYGLEKINLDKEKLRGQSIKTIISKLNIPLVNLPIIIKQITSRLSKQIDKLKPIPGIKQVLQLLKEKNYSLNIITSNTKNNIETFLKNNDLEIFDIIYSDSSIFGKHKVINRFLKNYNIKSEDAIYIGDETRDIEAAKKSGLKIIAVTWGFNDEEILKQYHPDFLINKPSELTQTVESL